MLVRTEFGKTIGGYTPYPWPSKYNNYDWIYDDDKRNFLFSLDMEEKFIPWCSYSFRADYCSGGPAFVDDLCIVDGCNNNTKSLSSFPFTFNRAGEDKLKISEEVRRMFIGGDT